jgi:hypothetical protein
VIIILARGRGTDLGEPLPVEVSDVVAGVEQLANALDLSDADRGLQVREPVVEAEAVVLHLGHVRRTTLVALAPHPLRNLALGGDQDPALAGGHLLVRIEGERRDVPGSADPPAH